MIRADDRSTIDGRSRAAVLSLGTILACGVVMLVGDVTRLPSVVWLVVAIALSMGLLVWGATVYIDARASGLGLGHAVLKSIRLTFRAAWELLP